MKVYKIKHGDKYKSAGDNWTKKGKVYTEIGHVTNALKSLAPAIIRKDFWKRVTEAKVLSPNPWGMHVSSLPQEWQDEYHTFYKMDWNELPRLMPDLVIEVHDNGGVREVSIKDWIEKRDKEWH